MFQLQIAVFTLLTSLLLTLKPTALIAAQIDPAALLHASSLAPLPAKVEPAQSCGQSPQKKVIDSIRSSCEYMIANSPACRTLAPERLRTCSSGQDSAWISRAAQRYWGCLQGTAIGAFHGLKSTNDILLWYSRYFLDGGETRRAFGDSAQDALGTTTRAIDEEYRRQLTALDATKSESERKALAAQATARALVDSAWWQVKEFASAHIAELDCLNDEEQNKVMCELLPAIGGGMAAILKYGAQATKHSPELLKALEKTRMRIRAESRIAIGKNGEKAKLASHETRLSSDGVAENSRSSAQGFVFDEGRARAQGDFLNDPVWDGSKPIPPDLEMTLPFQHVNGYRYDLSFQTASISDQDKSLRRLLNDVRHRSRADSPAREREFGAVLVQFDDGSTQVAKFTSNNIKQIDAADYDKALSSAIFYGENRAEGKRIKRIIDIHSHPNPQNPRAGPDYSAISPSPGDYVGLRALKDLAQRKGGQKDVEVLGIVLPNCPSCDDLMFLFDPQGINAH